jgi:hypothetical protein
LGRTPKPGEPATRSILAVAAYRSGERLYDNRIGRSFQYDRDDISHTEIMAPEGAAAWVFNRAQLWNAVERAECNKDGTARPNAQLAREFEISIPVELSPEARVGLVRSFVKEHVVGLGMVADVAIHCPKAANGHDQPHAHVLCTMRELDPSRATGFAKAKNRTWNEIPEIVPDLNEARKVVNDLVSAQEKGREVPLEQLEAAKANLEIWEARRRINLWRAAWSEMANAALERAGEEARIDHRTLAAQKEEALAKGNYARAAALDREPQKPIGLARRIVEKAYNHVRDRLTHWIGLKRREALYQEFEAYQNRDPSMFADWVSRITDMAEEFASRFRRTPPPPIPEVDLSHDR